MAKTTSSVGLEKSTFLSTYQKDQYFSSNEVWLSDITTFFLFPYPVIALPKFKQLLRLRE